ncbi:glycosyltransferase family 2 protein [Leeuwenhoekiella aequorea]|uniref:glycosyltransferase family 2 protein n=1 Tax=Leeuwenhoekiella aequorea TaxID=283736 RepID=UPI00352EFD15|tara:strand:+ start:10770 stop:11714 length:945 start_codon:yes stop_codon:yes gene_type:complete
MKETVYIVIAAFNRESLIKETLQSIGNQTYSNFKCIVIDDNSTDSTAEIVKYFADSDMRFKYYLKPPSYEQGLPQTRNYGLDIVESYNPKYVQFFDDDDIMHPQKLELQMNAFNLNDEVALVNCQYSGFREVSKIDFDKIDDEINVRTENPAKDFLFKKIKFHSCGPIFKWDLIKKMRFDRELKFFAEEEEFYLRMLFKENPAYDAIHRPLFYYRHHSKSVTGNNDNRIQKIGTTFILDQKMWDFFSENNLVDRDLIAYYTKRFSIDFYNKAYLKKIDTYLKIAPSYSVFYKAKIGILLKLYSFLRKVFFKILQ